MSALARDSTFTAMLGLVTLQAALAGSIQGVVRGPGGEPLVGIVVTVAETG